MLSIKRQEVGGAKPPFPPPPNIFWQACRSPPPTGNGMFSQGVGFPRCPTASSSRLWKANPLTKTYKRALYVLHGGKKTNKKPTTTTSTSTMCSLALMEMFNFSSCLPTDAKRAKRNLSACIFGGCVVLKAHICIWKQLQ